MKYDGLIGALIGSFVGVVLMNKLGDNWYKYFKKFCFDTIQKKWW